jgi:hypothetical protein
MRGGRESAGWAKALRRGGAAALGLAALACGGSPAEELDQASQAATSWAATAAWIGETWGRGEVPDHFAKRGLQRAEEALGDEEGKLDDLPPAARPGFGAHLRALRAAVGEARAAVRRGERAGIEPPLARIAAEARALRAMGSESGTAP